MSVESKKPQYTLEALLKLRRWDLDGASAESLRARQSLDECALESQRIGQAIADLELELRELFRGGTSIDTGRHVVLRGYLEDRRQALQAKLAELRQAERVFETARHRLYRIKQGVMVLEKHKDGKEKEHMRELQRGEQQQLDDIWLQHRQEE